MPPEAVTLLQGAQALGLSLTDAEVERLLAYQALILKWNRVYNLTAVRDPSEMLTHHLLDSLAVLPPLRRHLAGKTARLLDVGSGAGLPGVVLAAMEPGLEVVCVDTVGKKASFIQQAASELKLPNLGSRHARVESLNLPAFDLITSRAFSSLADFVALSRHLLKAGGAWLAMKGRHPQAEIDALPADVSVFHVEQLVVPGLDAERCLIWMRART
jgi:16S rRNA (guanine527-N7)-methyltransferase